MRENHIEAVAIVDLVLFGRPIVVAKNLLINVTEQMERFDTNVSALQAALKKRPEILKSVCVDLPIHVRHSMVDNLVPKSLVIESLIGHKIVGINRTALFHVRKDFWLKMMSAATGNDGCTYFFCLAVEDSDNWHLASDATASDQTATASLVHVACGTADECFVHFYFMPATAKFHEGFFLHCQTDAMQHEPCGLLGDAEIAGNLIRANAILAVCNHPYGNKPFVERDWRILENSSDFRAELPVMMDALTLPFVLIGKEHHILASTGGAFDAVGPANRDHVGEAISGFAEELNGFLECFWLVHDGARIPN